MMMQRRTAAAQKINTDPSLQKPTLTMKQWVPYHDDEIIKRISLPDVDMDVVPRRLFCTWHTHDTPPIMTANLKKIAEAHPGFELGLYDLDECRAFLSTYFTNEVVSAWEELAPHSYKSDIWRFAVLYVHGGIYFDVKFIPIDGFSFEEFIGPRDIICRDLEGNCPTKGITTGIMAVRPRCPYLLDAIKKICFNVRVHNYALNSLQVTGPCLLGLVFPDNTICEMKISPRLANNTNLVYWNGRSILAGYAEYRSEQSAQGNSYYMDLYGKRKIFNPVEIPKIVHGASVTGWENRVYTMEERRAFIAKNFPEAVLKAYDSFECKEALFCYCVLYLEGGVYMDPCYQKAAADILDQLWAEKRDVFVLAEGGCIHHSFVMCRPRDQRLRCAIWRIVKEGVDELHNYFNRDDLGVDKMPYVYMGATGVIQRRRGGTRVLFKESDTPVE